MADPAYAFTIPSLFDNLVLHCRIYLPESLGSELETSNIRLKGAIIAHPYAPLGGSYDDPVVLSVTESLLQQGYIVGTFNFRGTEESEGRSSWTGRGEIDDYASFVGFLLYYLSRLASSNDLDELPRLAPVDDRTSDSTRPDPVSFERPFHILLGGYSYGSLILARLPPVVSVLKQFEKSEKGTTYSEIFLRARTLAKHTRHNFSEERLPSKHQARPSLSGQPSPSGSPRLRASSVTVGGEESRSTPRRHSRDSKKSVDVVREIPHRIRTHIRRHSSNTQRSINESQHGGQANITSPRERQPDILIKYLMISPVLVPFTTILAPPGLSLHWSRAANDDTSTGAEAQSDLLSLKYPVLAVFGSSDTFTSSRKLRQWAENLGNDSHGRFEWTMIDRAGHFWREESAMQSLKSRIATWLVKDVNRPDG